MYDHFPLQGMKGFIWSDKEACIRLAGFLHDASAQNPAIQDVFQKKELENKRRKYQCSIHDPIVEHWVEKTATILIADGDKNLQGILLSYGFSLSQEE